jgi:hypothetical protein
MVYCYRKTDKAKLNPIELSNAVRFKSLWNKSLKLECDIRDYFLRNNLMFESESEETRQEIYKAIDCLSRFRENLNLKNNIEVDD